MVCEPAIKPAHKQSLSVRFVPGRKLTIGPSESKHSIETPEGKRVGESKFHLGRTGAIRHHIQIAIWVRHWHCSHAWHSRGKRSLPDSLAHCFGSPATCHCANWFAA